MEMTTPRRIGGRRRFAREPDDLLPALHTRDWNSGKQRLRIRMSRRTQHFIDQTALDDAPEVHYRHLMRQILHHGEIVRDEQIGQAEFVMQRLEQIENLRLYRDVEHRSRLVADDQVQRPRDGDALPLSAQEIVGVAPRWLP